MKSYVPTRSKSSHSCISRRCSQDWSLSIPMDASHVRWRWKAPSKRRFSLLFTVEIAPLALSRSIFPKKTWFSSRLIFGIIFSENYPKAQNWKIFKLNFVFCFFHFSNHVLESFSPLGFGRISFLWFWWVFGSRDLVDLSLSFIFRLCFFRNRILEDLVNFDYFRLILHMTYVLAHLAVVEFLVWVWSWHFPDFRYLSGCSYFWLRSYYFSMIFMGFIDFWYYLISGFIELLDSWIGSGLSLLKFQIMPRADWV